MGYLILISGGLFSYFGGSSGWIWGAWYALDQDFRILLWFVISLVWTAGYGYKLLYPSLKKIPATLCDGKFDVSDIFWGLTVVVHTITWIAPWIWFFKEVIS